MNLRMPNFDYFKQLFFQRRSLSFFKSLTQLFKNAIIFSILLLFLIVSNAETFTTIAYVIFRILGEFNLEERLVEARIVEGG
jgi:hypothetical protein